jgi:hypothetical protein
MFSKIAENWRTNRTKKLLERAINSEAIHRHADNFFEDTCLRDVSEATKDKLAAEFRGRLATIADAENSFSAFREDIANATLVYANIQVFELGPRDRNDIFFSPYISCALQPYIRQAADHQKEIGDYLSENADASDEDLLAFIRVRSTVHLYHMNGLQILRHDMKDAAQKPEDDWFRPFVKSMLIWHENAHRGKLGLPSLFKKSDILGSLQHSTFYDLVKNGYSNPLAEWQKSYGVHKQAC